MQCANLGWIFRKENRTAGKWMKYDFFLNQLLKTDTEDAMQVYMEGI